MTARDVWRWTDERGVQRLVGTDELRAALASSVLPAATLVWREGMKEWAPASTMPELASAAFAADEPGGRAKPKIADEDSFDSRSTQSRRATLIGVAAPVSEGPAAPPLPVDVPAASERGERPGVTQIPPFGAPRADVVRAPPPPRVPATPTVPQPAAGPRAPRAGGERPYRKIATSEIDGLWATTTHSDEDETLPRSRPSQLAAAAAAAAEAAVALRDTRGKARTEPPAKKPPPLPPRGKADAGANGQSAARPEIARDHELPAKGAVKPAPAKAFTTTQRPPPPPPPRPAFASGPLGVPVKPQVPPQSTPVRVRPPGGGEPTDLPNPRPMVTTLLGMAAPQLPVSAEAPKRTEATKTLASVADVDQAEARALIEDPLTAEPIDLVTRMPDSDRALPILRSDALEQARSVKPAEPTAGALPARPVTSKTRAHPPRPPQAVTPPPGEAATSEPSQEPAVTPPPGEAAPNEPAVTPPDVSTPPPGEAAAAKPVSTPPPAATELPTSIPPPVAALPLPPASATPAPAPTISSAPPPRPSRPPREVAERGEATRITRLPRSSDARGRAFGGPVPVPISSLLGAGGVLIGMVIAAFFAGRVSAVPEPRQKARPTMAAVPVLARAALPAPPKPCWMTKQPAMWAPRVSHRVPFEVTAARGDALMVGYARDAKLAVGIEVALASGEIQGRFEDRADGEIERVAPSAAGVFRVARADDGGALRSPVHVLEEAPFTVGIAAGAIAVASPPGAAPSALWPLIGDEGLGAASVHAAGNRGFALTFRRAGAVWSGWIGADRKAAGDLVKVMGSGGQVGKPAGGWNGREIAVIFADRPSEEARYEIRIGHGPAGKLPSATTVLPLPKGGPGGDAFAPDIAGLPDGRWILMWTEGAAGSRAVRALTLASDFTPLGDPIALSPPAGNFGQGTIGVSGGYAATVFLQKGASSYELWGSVLQCL